jgi:hypothetical protein
MACPLVLLYMQVLFYIDIEEEILFYIDIEEELRWWFFLHF